ncbi:MAG: hypothetical protein II661_04850, partial [Bacteroidales bacterium]|nr:hypothetical protein [Bacteroidales bacterium]
MTGNYKHIVEHVYFVDNNILYRDYTLYFIAAREHTHHSPGKIVLEGPLMHGDNFPQWFLPKNQIAPPKGSSVYLFPGCPYAVNDIRANYTIKRKIDTADYNVVSKDHVHSLGCFLDRDIYAVFPSQKIIVAGEKIAESVLYSYANALVDGKAPLDK